MEEVRGGHWQELERAGSGSDAGEQDRSHHVGLPGSCDGIGGGNRTSRTRSGVPGVGRCKEGDEGQGNGGDEGDDGEEGDEDLEASIAPQVWGQEVGGVGVVFQPQANRERPVLEVDEGR
eukprot:762723-Hanusia_phi.AAC.5